MVIRKNFSARMFRWQCPCCAQNVRFPNCTHVHIPIHTHAYMYSLIYVICSPELFHFWKCFGPQIKTNNYPIRAWIWSHVMLCPKIIIFQSPSSDCAITADHQYWPAIIHQACLYYWPGLNACTKTHIAFRHLLIEVATRIHFSSDGGAC